MIVTGPARQAESYSQGTCSAGDAIGDLVCISAQLVGRIYAVTKADPADGLKMPAVGAIIQKFSATSCLIQKTGVLPVSGTPDFDIGRTVYVGLDGRPTTVPPDPTLSSTGLAMLQAVGVAVSFNQVQLDLQSFSTKTPVLAADDTFVFAAGGLGLSTTPRYLSFGSTPRNAPSSPVTLRASRAGTFSNFRVMHNLTGTGGDITYTLRVNGVDSALSVTLTAGTANGADLVHSVVVSQNDMLDLRVSKAAAIEYSPSDITATLEFNI